MNRRLCSIIPTFLETFSKSKSQLRIDDIIAIPAINYYKVCSEVRKDQSVFLICRQYDPMNQQLGSNETIIIPETRGTRDEEPITVVKQTRVQERERVLKKIQGEGDNKSQ
jgi:hypothetical protein